MQIILIIGAIVFALGAFVFAFVREENLDKDAPEVDDPKRRGYYSKSASVWVWSLLLLGTGFLISLIWLFGSWERLYNYQGGFTLKPSSQWLMTEDNTDGAKQDYSFVYNDTEQGSLRITVLSLNREDAKTKKAEIKETKNKSISLLKKAQIQLKAKAKNDEKTLKLQSHQANKDLKSQIKQAHEDLKIALKEQKQRLKEALKAHKETLVQLKAAAKNAEKALKLQSKQENKEDLKVALKEQKQQLKEALKTHKEALVQLKAAAKNVEKELKLQNQQTTKDLKVALKEQKQQVKETQIQLKANAKNVEKELKLQSHQANKELKIALKEQKQRLKEALKAHKETLVQLKANAKNDEQALKLQSKQANKEDLKVALKEQKQRLKEALKAHKEALVQLKATAKNAEKELKLQSKQANKELKVALKEQKQHLKEALKGDTKNDEKELNLQNQQENLAAGLESIKIQLKQDLAENRKQMDTLWQKGWLLQKDNSFTALRKNRLYTVYVSPETNLSLINIGPSGFFRGLFDGSLFPGAAAVSIFNPSIHPYKKINNGFRYVLGFISGSLVLVGFLLWRVYIAIMKKNREQWKAQWRAMPTHEKVTYIVGLYEAEYEAKQHYNKYELERITEEYTRYERSFRVTPETALEDCDTKSEKGVGKKIGGFFADVFTAGKASREEAENQYNAIAEVYHYFNADYKVASAEAAIANTQYNFIRKKAVFYVKLMKELIANFTYEQKNLFDQAQKMEVDKMEFSAVDIRGLLDSIASFNHDYHIKAVQAWDRTWNFANDMVDNGLDFLKKQKSRNGQISNEDLAVAGVSAAIGVGAVAVQGCVQYFENCNNNDEIKARLQKGMAEIRGAIKESKQNKIKAEAFVKRADEICNYLEEAMQRYTTMFYKISAELFPEGDAFKSKNERTKREKGGESYYTNEEVMIIRPLGKYAKIMSQVIEADF